ncbi:MAG: cell wall hydrolase, partial [Sphingomicrobium sp.]
MVAALTATIIAPAKAGPSGEPVLPATTAAVPEVPVPQLLDPNGEPILSEPRPDTQTQPDEDQLSQPAVKPTGDLASMVAQMRTAEAGSRELECLATGVYFEAKGEPLAGQLAVAKVIANRAQSGGRFPDSYCGVLFQRGQFSFVHGRSL